MILANRRFYHEKLGLFRRCHESSPCNYFIFQGNLSKLSGYIEYVIVYHIRFTEIKNNEKYKNYPKNKHNFLYFLRETTLWRCLSRTAIQISARVDSSNTYSESAFPNRFNCTNSNHCTDAIGQFKRDPRFDQ